MTMQLAQRVQGIQPSPTLSINAHANALRAEGRDIINLGAGEPDFDTPLHIQEAAIKAIRDGFTRYTAVDGIVSLKEVILKKFIKDNQLSYDLKQVIVCCGAKHVIYNCMQALLNLGDEVIIPAPYWVSYPDMVRLANGKPVTVSTEASNRYKITPDQLREAITEKTRMIIFNSPSNPTGYAYSKKEWEALAEVLLDHPNVFILTDDIYEHVLWTDEPFTNIVMTCPELVDRTLVVNGVSKAYAMTGWRIGYAGGPTELIARMKIIQSQSTSNPNSIAQVAAEAALTGDQQCVSEMTKVFKERHDLVIEKVNQTPGIHCQVCDGTFYAFIEVGDAIRATNTKDDVEFTSFLLDKAEIAVVPGIAFGAPGHIRLSFATDTQSLEKAFERLRHCLEKVQSH